ncbi:MAG: hypothetical protein Q4F66_01755 [Clostridium sp.]|nr:hypothetical protein [Clostridium sp.]
MDDFTGVKSKFLSREILRSKSMQKIIAVLIDKKSIRAAIIFLFTSKTQN